MWLRGSPRNALPEKSARFNAWLADWNYFATDQPIEVSQLDEPVKGLQLPKRVVEKIYRLNAERFFGGAFQGAPRR